MPANYSNSYSETLDFERIFPNIFNAFFIYVVFPDPANAYTIYIFLKDSFLKMYLLSVLGGLKTSYL